MAINLNNYEFNIGPIIDLYSTWTFSLNGLYFFGYNSSNGYLYKHTVVEAWDISTIQQSPSQSLYIGTLKQQTGFQWRYSTKLAYTGTNGYTYMRHFGSAYDLSSTTSLKSKDLSPWDGYESGLFWSSSTQFFLLGNTTDNIIKFNCSTGDDPSTATQTYSKSVFKTGDSNPSYTGFSFSKDGMYLYIGMSDNHSDFIRKFSMSTAYQIELLTFVKDFLLDDSNIMPGKSNMWKDESTYITNLYRGYTGEINLSTPNDLVTGKIASNAITGIRRYGYDETSSIKMSPDGSKLFVSDGYYGKVRQYELSEAFNIKTKSLQYDQGFIINNGLDSIEFGDNGNILYVCSDDYWKYSLNSQYSIQAYTQVNQDNGAISTFNNKFLRISEDGTKVITDYNTIRSLREYTLSTAFNFATATYIQDFYISVNGNSIEAWDINSDGTKLIYFEYDTGYFYLRTLSTPWDLSTISEVQQVRAIDKIDNVRSIQIVNDRFILAFDGAIAFMIDDPVVNKFLLQDADTTALYTIVNGVESYIINRTNPLESDFQTYGFTNENDITQGILEAMSIGGNIKLLNYTDDLNITSKSVIHQYQSYPQLVKANGDINLKNVTGINSISITTNEVESGQVRMIVSVDSGITWKTWDGSNWQDVDISNLDNVKSFGMPSFIINGLSTVQWDLLINGVDGIRFAYYLEITGPLDVAEVDQLDVDFDYNGRWEKAEHMADFDYFYENDLFTVQFFVDGDFKINY